MVTYHFEKKVNQKINLGQRPPIWCQMPTRPDTAILLDGNLPWKNLSKIKKKKKKKTCADTWENLYYCLLHQTYIVDSHSEAIL